MRCPDCNKFVPFDTEVWPEENDVSVDGLTVMMEYRRVLNCGECGTELKETTLTLEHELDETELKAEHAKCSKFEEGHVWEVESPDASATERREDGRRGKTFYGVEVSGKAKCECGAEIEFTASGEEQASAFDELV